MSRKQADQLQKAVDKELFRLGKLSTKATELNHPCRFALNRAWREVDRASDSLTIWPPQKDAVS